MRSKSDNGKDYGVLGLFKKGTSIHIPDIPFANVHQDTTTIHPT